MLDLMQSCAAFTADVYGTPVTITDQSAVGFDVSTNTVTQNGAIQEVKGIWTEGMDKAVAKQPDGGVTIVRGLSRSIQIPAKDLTFTPKKGDLLTRKVGSKTEQYQIGDATRHTIVDGDVFLILQLEIS